MPRVLSLALTGRVGAFPAQTQRETGPVRRPACRTGHRGHSGSHRTGHGCTTPGMPIARDTDTGADEWRIVDEVIRLRTWGTGEVYPLPRRRGEWSIGAAEGA